MKPYEQFVDKMLRAVNSSQGKDPLAATEIIQQALRSAGLLQTSAASPSTSPSPSPTQDARKPLVDLNEAPAWARQASVSDTAPESAAESSAEFPLPGADAMRDWIARFMPRAPGASASTSTYARTGNVEAPGQFLSGSFSADAGTRRYRLYVPAQRAEGTPALVVMLHGCQQDPDDFAAGTNMNALAERHGCLVLYPEQARSANGSNCWNWFEAPHQQREQGEPSIIAGMTRAVMREHGVDPGRVYVAGLSAGGAMAAILGATYPDLYAAVGVHSGLPAGSAHDLMSGLNAMKGARKRPGAPLGRAVPAIVFHGDQDAVVHPSNGHAVLRQFASGAPGTPLREAEQRGQDGAGRDYTRLQLLDGNGHAVAEHWTVHGAGHAWAGGSSTGSYTDPSGPDASGEMLRFFLAQPRS